MASSRASGPEAAPPARAPAREWLDLGDDTAPEVFLARRSAPPGTVPSPEAEARLARLLTEADAVFDESRRMLANRTLQLERMLAERSLGEPPEDLLQGFIEVGRTVRRIGYSDLCQHYFNLRVAGAGRKEALAALVAPSAGTERRSP